MNSLQGKLLVASPELRDPNFLRTVVLILQHDQNGAFGLVLNRRSETKLTEIWSKLGKSPCQIEASLHLGGPVDGPLLVLHSHAGLSDMQILPAVYVSTNPEELEQLVAQPGVRARFFACYSGWGAGQLEAEIEEGSWLITAATIDDIFDADANSWERLSRRIADRSLIDALQIKHVPKHPSMN